MNPTNRTPLSANNTAFINYYTFQISATKNLPGILLNPTSSQTSKLDLGNTNLPFKDQATAQHSIMLLTNIVLVAGMGASLVSAQILTCPHRWHSMCCIVDYDLTIPTTACKNQ
jgi:hypothetical protein